MSIIKTISSLRSYCKDHSIQFKHLPSVINDPKVVPMIRGYAFEFDVFDKVKKLFSKTKRFYVEKPYMNAEIFHPDIDIKIFDTQNKNSDGENSSYMGECKLAKNNSFKFRTRSKNYPFCQIKCMRSRTLGKDKIVQVANRLGISEDLLNSHKDSYRYDHFDLVFTNLSNAFYRTNTDGKFVLSPSDDEIEFLKLFFNTSNSKKSLKLLRKEKFFSIMKETAPLSINNKVCNRRGCISNNECGFVPNNILFRMDNLDGWYPINQLTEKLIKY